MHVAADALQPTSTATIARVRDGDTLTTDGHAESEAAAAGTRSEGAQAQ